MYKKLMSALALGAAALCVNLAYAHGGGAAKHGGVVAIANDLSFELVGLADAAHIYVEDHGKPILPSGLKGKLTVLLGTEKVEAELLPSGDKLEAKGIKLSRGAKAVAVLNTSSAKTMTVRFIVK